MWHKGFGTVAVGYPDGRFGREIRGIPIGVPMVGIKLSLSGAETRRHTIR
jgi:hypothetical protein